MRETGPARRELSDEEAAPYIGFARTSLGQLKNDMRFVGLQQGKRTRRLPDGTAVVVTSVFGQDKISIEKPVVESRPQEEEVALHEQEPVETELQESKTPLVERLAFGGFIIGGYCETSQGDRAAIWRNRETIDPGLVPGTSDARTNDVSDDGGTAVGMATAAFLGVHPDYRFAQAWHWRARTGLALLPVPYAYSRANGVNIDGSVIVGSAGPIEPNIPFVWSSATGFAELPTLGLGGHATKVAREGGYIIGEVFVDGQGYEGCLWIKAGTSWSLVMLPAPGTSSTNPEGSTGVDVTVAAAVNDRGRVSYRTTHTVYNSFTESYVAVGPHGTIDPSHGFVSDTLVAGQTFTHWQEALPTLYPVFTFVAATGLNSEVGSLGEALAAAGDRHMLVGREVIGTSQDIVTYGGTHDAHTGVNGPDVSDIIRGSYTAFVEHGWYWTPVTGKVDLGDYTTAIDVTEAATAIAGARRVRDTFWLPVVWKGGAGNMQPADLPLLPGGTAGQATCVGSTLALTGPVDRAAGTGLANLSHIGQNAIVTNGV